MAAEAIFGPFVGMLILTLGVWVYMYIRRLSFLRANRIDAQQLTTPEKGMQVIPEEINYAAHNLRNLFELPVVFYALSLYLYVSGTVDAVYVIAGWIFLGTRIVHSLIHCTINIVVARFLAYAVGALTVWFMVLRAALGEFG